MTHLTANLTPDDRARAYRLVIAWVDNDRLALDTVLGECVKLPTGTPGLVFALTEFTASLGTKVAPDFAGQLRSMLLMPDHDEPPDDARDSDQA